MSAHVQNLLVLAIFGLTVAAFVWRAFARRRKPGCGGDCGCASSKLKARL